MFILMSIRLLSGVFSHRWSIFVQPIRAWRRVQTPHIKITHNPLRTTSCCNNLSLKPHLRIMQMRLLQLGNPSSLSQEASQLSLSSKVRVPQEWKNGHFCCWGTSLHQPVQPTWPDCTQHPSKCVDAYMTVGESELSALNQPQSQTQNPRNKSRFCY